jgi:hypothetical protein
MPILDPTPPAPGVSDLDEVRAAEIHKIDDLIGQFFGELEKQPLTTAQRISALSEIRKCVQFKCVLLGLVEPQQERDIY